MSTAFFTSLHGGMALQEAVLTLISGATAHAATGAKVEVQIMCFAFTDDVIAQALTSLARQYPGVTVRILADWSQSARGGPSVIDGLAQAGCPNLYIKVKLDAPYRWDATKQRLRYSYAASSGMLHHKTLCLLINGLPLFLALGSYNWSGRGRQAYENLLVLGPTDCADILEAFTLEFKALWSDHRLTASLARSRSIFQRLLSEARKGSDLRDPVLLADILGIAGAPLRPECLPARTRTEGDTLAAFSGSHPLADASSGGHSLRNDRRYLDLLRPSGTRRPAPLTLNTLALEAIRAVPDGAGLDLAIYALSPRVPEFAALLDAARRGCRVRVLLDGTLGAGIATSLRGFADREGLPIALRLTGRRMHQKYLCCAEAGLVLTGTANMTEDATLRHSDHRILFRNAPVLAQAFLADFEEIWRRLPMQANPDVHGGEGGGPQVS
jgi:phosphatidylserine/phosphatidylglycerophosphate/cardiolipin synthase-like enzyme